MLRIFFLAKIWRLHRLVYVVGICSDAHSAPAAVIRDQVAMQDATAAAA